MQESLANLHRLVWISLVAALIVAGGYVHFPLGPVPFSLQTLFVLLSGFVLGPIAGFAAVGLYLLAGAAGLPVFHGGTSGLGHILGPTGGYLAGFLLTPWITGLAGKAISSRPLPWAWALGFALAGNLPIYLLGLLRLQMLLQISWSQTLLTGLVPFLPADLIKVFLCAALVRFLQRNQLSLQPS
ncbi:MAG: biotin transporter BioY [Desulfohalobiaceae bacterium]